MTLRLASPDFPEGGEIPRECGYKNGNQIPRLMIGGIPSGCRSLALVMDDPDAMAAVGKIWVHWVVWSIPPDATEIGGSWMPDGTVEGMTDFGSIGYGGPAPPDRRHTYIFKIYALDSELNLPRGADKAKVEEAVKGRVIEEARLTGTYEP